MGDTTDVAAVNRVLKWIGIELVSSNEVRALPDPNDPAGSRRPSTLLGVFSDPDARGAYALAQAPQLDRLIRAFRPLGTSLWRENPLPTPSEKRAILDILRSQMQVSEDSRAAGHGRILATTLYWNAVKSLRLAPAEARHEAAALRAIATARSGAADRPNQEIARNAALALGVLLETYPGAK